MYSIEFHGITAYLYGNPRGGGEYFYIIFVQYDMLTKLVIHTTASS